MALPFIGIEVRSNISGVLASIEHMAYETSVYEIKSWSEGDFFRTLIGEFREVMEMGYSQEIPYYSKRGWVMEASGASRDQFDNWEITNTSMSLNNIGNGLHYANQGQPPMDSPPPQDIIAAWIQAKGTWDDTEYKAVHASEETLAKQATWLASKSIMEGREPAETDPISMLITPYGLGDDAVQAIERAVEEHASRIIHHSVEVTKTQQAKSKGQIRTIARMYADAVPNVRLTPRGYKVDFQNRINGRFASGFKRPAIEYDMFGREI